MRGKSLDRLIGRSPLIVALQKEMEQAACSDTPILILGERGVEKEAVARRIHALSSRASMRFVSATCAGSRETLLESELFGQVKDGVIGADRDRPGKLETAHAGTVYLHGIGEMPLRVQGQLVRFLETGRLTRVGVADARQVDVRLMAATGRDLGQMVTQGTFREDLYRSVSRLRILVPPLRDRPEDIPLLTDYFLPLLAAVHRSRVTGVAPDAMDALIQYAWPGNVRELESLIERLVLTVQDRVIDVQDLPAVVRPQDGVTFRPRPERRRTSAGGLHAV